MQIINVQPETVFQALSDATRLRIMRLLCLTQEEACLCEFVDALQEPQYKLSRHIKVLKQAGLLSAWKDGRWIYHKLVDDTEFLQQLHKTILLLTDTSGVYDADLQRFNERMTLRESGRCRIGVQNKALLSETASKQR